MLLLRDVHRSDLPGLGELARILNTVNLPNDEKELVSVIDHSTRSFAGRVRDPFEREYRFVAEDVRSGTLVGTSLVIAQHGTHEAPHIYLDVKEREHYSATVDRHFRHKVLSIGYNYEGPTEIGGLVVHPRQRHKDKPGKQLSFVRFLFIAMHRARFRDRVLAELLPPLLPDGRSLLWEAFGKKFTGLTYLEADRMSRKSKEFIQQLFPQSEVYATFFNNRVRRVIGAVGEDTKPVQRMLERIGFGYVDRIDPFDGGPHFEADVASVTLVQRHRRAKVSETDLEGEAPEHLVAFEPRNGKHHFVAVKSPCRVEGRSAYLPLETKEVLGASAGTLVDLIPFE